MIQGFVKWFDGGKGYGFLTGQDGEDYFVHYTGIGGDGFKNLENDQQVVFDTETCENGKTKAINVTQIKEEN